MATAVNNQPGVRPAERIASARAYVPPSYAPSIVLRLDNNEGPEPSADLRLALDGVSSEAVRRYPVASDLERDIAQQFGVDPLRVVVTNGGDEAIDRICRAMIEPGRGLLTHDPVFEMIPRAARLSGGEVSTVRWLEGALDVDAVIERIDERVGVVAVVSPCNPTGATVGLDDLLRLADAAQRFGAVLLADLAYVEFADEDPTTALLERDNVVVVRTFSKAFGLAGLRVGYAVASEAVAGWMRSVGGPYPVSGPALAVAREALAIDNSAYIERVRAEREDLIDRVQCCGGRPQASSANFVLARFDDAETVWTRLADAGVAVRRFVARAGLEDALRVSLPGDPKSFAYLLDALEYAMGRGPMPEWRVPSGSRRGSATRSTKETSIRCAVVLDGTGASEVRTGLGFLDHMLTALARHSSIDIELACRGDLEVDDHHTVEDCALVLGSAIDDALGRRAGIARFAEAYAPLDEALCRAVVDLSGRPSAHVVLDLKRELVGDVAAENIEHFVRSLADRLRAAIHLDTVRGENDHHKAEAGFKALALALGRAVRVVRPDGEAPSTKGVL
ncbi:MAG: imidazoleglycerol-phosphate dehydratase HisB [Phycisphaerales bacterium]|nr:imidazoleglycerol-phosphate dehydratase HisB [Phycisphaerales bacterium]